MYLKTHLVSHHAKMVNIRTHKYKYNPYYNVHYKVKSKNIHVVAPYYFGPLGRWIVVPLMS